MNTVQNALCSKSLNHETVNAVNTPWHGDSLTSDSILFYNMQVNVFWCTNSDMFYKLWTVSWHPNSYITLIVAIINNYVGSQLQNEYFWEQKISSTKKRKDCVCAFVCVCVWRETERESTLGKYSSQPVQQQKKVQASRYSSKHFLSLYIKLMKYWPYTNATSSSEVLWSTVLHHYLKDDALSAAWASH